MQHAVASQVYIDILWARWFVAGWFPEYGVVMSDVCALNGFDQLVSSCAFLGMLSLEQHMHQITRSTAVFKYCRK